jgi:hypothetical protein
MKNALRRAAVTGGLLALVAMMAGAASGAKLTTKSETATLPADSDTHTVTAKCPKGAKVTGGGIQLSDDLNDFVQGTYPEGKRKWTAAAWRDATIFITDTEFTAFARCAKGVKVSTESATTSLENDLAAHAVTAKCPKGTKVTGGGARLADDVNDYVSGSFPASKREWTAEGHGADNLTVLARCLKGKRVTRASNSLDMPDDGATHTVTAKCPKGTKMTGGGVELSEPYDDFLQGSYPTGKRGWTAAGYDEGIVTAHVLCLKKKKRN